MPPDRAAPVRPLTTLRLAAALLVLVSLSAACSSAGSTTKVANLGKTGATPKPSASVSAKDREAALLDFAKCMRTNGVKDFPDPTVDSNGNPRLGFGRQDRNNPTVQKAFTACQSKLAAARPTFDPKQRQQLQDALLAYAKCMRANGYQMADPVIGPTPGQRPTGGPFGNINRNDPAFKKADTVCHSKLGDFGNGGPGGPGGPGAGGPPPGGAN
ncbi:MAG: hypothetical protein M3O55_05645 [Actinomycetota bacterium]|nr:hypothetical protein [Actinomycetota bacterium]